MSERNQVTFDFAQNPELKALFANWEAGKSYRLEIGFQLDSMDDNGAKGTIEEVVHEEKGEEPKSIEPTESSPVMIVMMGKATKMPAMTSGTATGRGASGY